jgi:hypothetical protein
LAQEVQVEETTAAAVSVAPANLVVMHILMEVVAEHHLLTIMHQPVITKLPVMEARVAVRVVRDQSVKSRIKIFKVENHIQQLDT